MGRRGFGPPSPFATSNAETDTSVLIFNFYLA